MVDAWWTRGVGVGVIGGGSQVTRQAMPKLPGTVSRSLFARRVFVGGLDGWATLGLLLLI